MEKSLGIFYGISLLELEVSALGYALTEEEIGEVENK